MRHTSCYRPRVAIRNYVLDWVSEMYTGERPLLDVGCGDGRFVVALDRILPGAVFGYDVPEARSRCEAGVRGTALEARFESVFRFEEPGPLLPYPDDSFELLVCNQVIEHIRDLDGFLHGCARVLHPGGKMLCVFPPVTHIIEAHTRVPGLHWFPPGPLRRGILGASHHVFGIPSQRGTEEVPVFWDRWLREKTWYRSISSVARVASRHFGEVRDDAFRYACTVFGASVIRSAPVLRWAPHIFLNCTLVLGKPRF